MAGLSRPEVPFIPQMEVVECGAAALAMVLAAYGHHAPLSELRQDCGVSRNGVNATGIVEAARKRGLESDAVRAEVADLQAIPLPAILHWEFNHFVVLESVTNRGAVILDPAVGRVELTLPRLSEAWTGVAIVCIPGEHFAQRPKSLPSFRPYRRILRTSAPALVQIALATIVLQILALAFPLGTQFVIDEIIVPRSEAWLPITALVLACAVAMRVLLTFVRSRIVQQIQVTIDSALMTDFFTHLIHLPLGFFLQRQPGDLAQRARSNTAIREALSSRMVGALLDTLLLAGYGAIMFLFDPLLAAVVVTAAAIRTAVVVSFRRVNRRLMTVELAAVGRENATLVEALTSIEAVKAGGSEARIASRWLRRVRERIEAMLARRKVEIITSELTSMLQGVTIAAVVWLGALAVVDGRMTVGVFATFLTLQLLIAAPIDSLLDGFTRLQLLGSHLARLDDVLETTIEPTGTTEPPLLRGAIELQNVSYAYSSGAEPVLSGMSLTIRPGEKVAFVGSIGAGKSTLVRLLAGIYLPIGGRILFDGHDLRDLDLHLLRRQIGVVLQETFIFDDTLRANLALGRIIDDAVLAEALAVACLDEVVARLPEGVDTRLGPGGSRLSGGERQRVALARALLKRSPILILDEATSALDAGTEERLHANLRHLGCTRIVISHRPAAIADADRVIMLEAGRILRETSIAEILTAPPEAANA
jgi:ABC-type bacteriocin/lantibiotic exporters, contain an N-terminal double-glycine peptidase domain